MFNKSQKALEWMIDKSVHNEMANNAVNARTEWMNCNTSETNDELPPVPRFCGALSRQKNSAELKNWKLEVLLPVQPQKISDLHYLHPTFLTNQPQSIAFYGAWLQAQGTCRDLGWDRWRELLTRYRYHVRFSLVHSMALLSTQTWRLRTNRCHIVVKLRHISRSCRTTS